MDGLSAAASGIAVVSLAIQLVDSVEKIKRFLRNVSDAPKELERLVDLLDQLELILQQIAQLVQQQIDARSGETDIPTTVMRAIKTCESKLGMLEKLIETTKQASSASNRATRTIGSLKLAWKKKDIQECENQLRDAINLLTLTMMANLTYVHAQSTRQLLNQVLATNQTASNMSQELILIRTGLVNNGLMNSNILPDVAKESTHRGSQSTRSSTSTVQSRTFQTYTSPFGKLIVRRVARSTNINGRVVQSSSGTYTMDESNWVFMPSFLSSCVDFRYLSTCGNIQRYFRTYPVISDYHEVWKMCRTGDVQGIQGLISEGKVSPFSVDSEGSTLLHFATGLYKSNFCEFLFQMGLTGEESDISGRPAHRPSECCVVFSDSGLQDFKRTYQLFTSRIDDLNPEFFVGGPFYNFFRYEVSFYSFNATVDELVSTANINKFRCSPAALAIRRLWESYPTDSNHESWRQLTLRLLSLSLGADGHNSSNYRRDTLLEEILNMVERPFESISIGRLFLDILSDLKVDVVEYLQVECERHFDSLNSLPMLHRSQQTSNRERYLIVSEAPSSVSWKWFIDPDGSAFEVLNEFKNFGTGEQQPFIYEKNNWPFFYPEWCKYTWGLQGYRNLSREKALLIRNCENRFQRRQQKKEFKLARAQGVFYRDPKIPGAWIE